MDVSEDPPITGDLWWCSAVDVTGLPSGAALSVLVPLREPLAPGALVTLFARQANGTWQPLTAQGIVTFDGQHAAYVHPGGVIATGIQNRFQPKLVKPPIKPAPSTPTRIPPTPRPNATSPVVPANPPNPISPPIKIKIITGTPTKIPNVPTLTPTVPVLRATRITPAPPVETAAPATATKLPPTLTPAQATQAPHQPTATVTVGAKPPVPTATTVSACTSNSHVVCFGQGGKGLVSLCLQTGVNCISTGKDGSICFAAFGGKVQCAAPGSTVIFSSNTSSLTVLAPSNTPQSNIIVVVVTATSPPTCQFEPDGSIDCPPGSLPSAGPTALVVQGPGCVQQADGSLSCPPAPPTSTVTPRPNGGECFNLAASGTNGTVEIPICINTNGVECVQQPLPPGVDAPFTCLSPGEPGYIPLP